MFIIPSNGYSFTVTMQGDFSGSNTANVFTQSQCTIRVKREDTYEMCRYLVEIDYTTCVYYSDPSGLLVIDANATFRRYFQAGVTIARIRISCLDTSGNEVDSVYFEANLFPGIGYSEVFAPALKDFDYWPAYRRNVILPPNVILAPQYFPNNPDFLEEFGVFVESNYNQIDGEAQWGYDAGGEAERITPIGAQLQFPVSAETLTLTTGKDEPYVTKSWRLVKPESCANLVVCRWTSLTGVVRQHFFPILSFIKGNDEQVALTSSGNALKVSKANYTAVRCRLDGLTPYGVWYYLDILQASDLHAIIFPTISQFRTEIASPMTEAFIESDGGETPTGNGLSSLEFVIKMKRYDKV